MATWFTRLYQLSFGLFGTQLAMDQSSSLL
jgi:hypothetical protein